MRKVRQRYYLVIALVIVISGAALINADFIEQPKWHDAGSIKVTLDNGCQMNLQEALPYLVEGAEPPDICSGDTSSVVHDASDVVISVDGADKTLQDAVGETNGLCPSQGTGSDSPSGCLSSNDACHLSTEIKVIIDGVDMSLQDAINDGEFCQQCVAETCESLGIECGTPDDGCGNQLDCGECTDQVCFEGVCVSGNQVDCCCAGVGHTSAYCNTGDGWADCCEWTSGCSGTWLNADFDQGTDICCGDSDCGPNSDCSSPIEGTCSCTGNYADCNGDGSGSSGSSVDGCECDLTSNTCSDGVCVPSATCTWKQSGSSCVSYCYPPTTCPPDFGVGAPCTCGDSCFVPISDYSCPSFCRMLSYVCN